MKLTQLFSEVHGLWATTSMFQLGAWLVFVSAVAYGGNRLAAGQYSAPKVYLLFSVVLVLSIGAIERALAVTPLLANPLIALLLAITTGAGCNVYRRLVE